MNILFKKIISTLSLILVFSAAELTAQSSELVKDRANLMEIPGLLSIAGSETHFYALSSSDGLIVFRAHEDRLQWLYSSEGMQRRGNHLQADIRFAYLTGDGNRLSVIEPTSVLGVYSSTTLPAAPGPLARAGDMLFLGMDKNGLFKLPLTSPEAFDTEPTAVQTSLIGDNKVLDIAATGRQLLVLTSAGNLHQFRVENNQAEHQRTFELNEEAYRIHLLGRTVMLSNNSGTVFELSGAGELFPSFRIPTAISDIFRQNDTFIVRSADGQIFGVRQDERPFIMRSDTRAANLITKSRNTIWLSEYNQVSSARLIEQQTASEETTQTGTSGSFSIRPIDDQVLPFPRVLLLPVQVTGDIPSRYIRFQVRGPEGATIRDQGFSWQPSSRNIGENQFTIIANSLDGQVDSTSFMVDVRAFNAPPRFNPVRPLSIPVGERFELPVRATDPDGSDPQLIRYLGVNLPTGATVNEQTGQLTWTPTRRQTGSHEFQVIATDQFGSAASLSLTINVLEISRD